MLTAATYLMLPEKTRSRFVDEQIKTIEHLRDKGCSWAQIKTVLSQIGIDLTESTLRSYYSRGLAQKAKDAKGKKNRARRKVSEEL